MAPLEIKHFLPFKILESKYTGYTGSQIPTELSSEKRSEILADVYFEPLEMKISSSMIFSDISL